MKQFSPIRNSKETTLYQYLFNRKQSVQFDQKISNAEDVVVFNRALFWALFYFYSLSTTSVQLSHSRLLRTQMKRASIRREIRVSVLSSACKKTSMQWSIGWNLWDLCATRRKKNPGSCSLVRNKKLRTAHWT